MKKKTKKTLSKTPKKSLKDRKVDIAVLEDFYIKSINEMNLHDNISVYACDYLDISNGYTSVITPYTCVPSEGC